MHHVHHMAKDMNRPLEAARYAAANNSCQLQLQLLLAMRYICELQPSASTGRRCGRAGDNDNRVTTDKKKRKS